ncbi:MAG: acyl-CoA dehydratase activase [Promethearchaeota archaeon]
MIQVQKGKEFHDIKYFEGLEIGTISVKWVRRNKDGKIISEVRRHEGYPKEVIEDIIKKYNISDTSNMVITGNATKAFFNLPYYSEAECLEKALAYYNLKPDILLSLGGETFSVFPMKDGVIKNIISTSKCAAGTGEFIVQQLKRMGLTLEEGIEKSKKGEFTKLATRCSVHCKSDATHKLNKGECLPQDIAKTLIHDLARKVSEMINSSQWPSKLIVISGGVGLNEVFISDLQNFLPESEIKTLAESPFLEAFGASLIASEIQTDFPCFKDWFKQENISSEIHEPLTNAEFLLDYRVDHTTRNIIRNNGKYILGIDSGSTTTKAVLYNIKDGSVGASVYLRTLGNPILATKKCLSELIKQIGDNSINIIQCGVTGSAREIVSVYLDNCLTFNEILAHAKSAIKELPEVNTVFEIGGQDSKFISFLKGIPIDYAMNEGCSAGTGSFLEESASVDMGISVENISNIALKSKTPIVFGERCAAFINTDLRNALQQGAKQEDVVAGLVYSIADNYISRIIGPRHIGENLLFLGGVALNKSVALAIAAFLQRKVIVPSHPELMGSIGTALMAFDSLKNDDAVSEKNIKLETLIEGEMKIKNSFRCNTCENHCEIQNISIRGHKYPFGGNCSKYRLLRQKSKIKEGENLIELRNNLMYKKYGPQTLNDPLGIVGIPMSLSSHILFPLYTKFINEIGFNVTISNPTKKGATKTLAAICYPCELVHGAIFDLIEHKIENIFLPYVIEMNYTENYLHGYLCPSAAGLPNIIQAAFEKYPFKLLSPHISLSKDHNDITIRELASIAIELGVEKSKGENAAKKALAHYSHFIDEYKSIGIEKIKEIGEDPSIIIAGRPYVIYPSDVNLALPRKIMSRGYHVIPMDILPYIKEINAHKRNVWIFTQQIENAINHALQNSNMYICLLSCFSCGPDSIMYHHFRQQLEGSTFCYLEIDSHTAHAGFETRVEAFLDIIEGRKRNLNYILNVI